MVNSKVARGFDVANIDVNKLFPDSHWKLLILLRQDAKKFNSEVYLFYSQKMVLHFFISFNEINVAFLPTETPISRFGFGKVQNGPFKIDLLIDSCTKFENYMLGMFSNKPFEKKASHLTMNPVHDEKPPVMYLNDHCNIFKQFCECIENESFIYRIMMAEDVY